MTVSSPIDHNGIAVSPDAIPPPTTAAEVTPRAPTNTRCSTWQRLPHEQQAAFVTQLVSQRHAVASVGAAVVGAGILFARKGTKPHRIVGRIWTGIAVLTSLNAFRLRDADGKLTWFHGFSALTLGSAAAGVYYARTKKITRHKKLMGVAYASAVLAGVVAWATPGKRAVYDSSAWGALASPASDATQA